MKAKASREGGGPHPTSRLPEAILVRASQLRRGRDYLGMMRVFEAALRRHPNNYAAISGIAGAQLAMGRRREAANSYRKAIAAAPHEPWAYVALANIYRAIRSWGQAMKWYKAAIQAAPRDAYPLSMLASFLQNRQRLKEALALRRKAVRLSGNGGGDRHDRALEILGLAYLLVKMGREDEAVRILNAGYRSTRTGLLKAEHDYYKARLTLRRYHAHLNELRHRYSWP